MNAILSFILEHAYRWLKILLIFFVADQVFRVFVASGWLTDVQHFIWYLANISFYKLMPEVAVVYVLNVFMFFVSIELLYLVFGKKHATEAHHTEEKK